MKVYIKIILISMLSMMLFSSCITKSWAQPKWFTNQFENKDTGLSQLLDTDGAFKAKGYIIFFNNGLVCSSGGELPTKENAILQTPPLNKDNSIWGTYIVKDNIIETQIIVDNGIDGFKANRHFYKIINRKQIQHVGYMSYHDKYFEREYLLDYVSVPNRMDSTNWLLKKKWFWKKGAKK